jgi:hypothetical protein
MRLKKAKIVIVPIKRTTSLQKNCEDFVRSLYKILDRRQQGEVVCAVFEASRVSVTVKVSSVPELIEYVTSFADALFKAEEEFSIVILSGGKSYEVNNTSCACPKRVPMRQSTAYADDGSNSAPLRMPPQARGSVPKVLPTEPRREREGDGSAPKRTRKKVGTLDPLRRDTSSREKPFFIEEGGLVAPEQFVCDGRPGFVPYKAAIERLFRYFDSLDGPVVKICAPSPAARGDSRRRGRLSGAEVPTIEEDDWVH